MTSKRLRIKQSKNPSLLKREEVLYRRYNEPLKGDTQLLSKKLMKVIKRYPFLRKDYVPPPGKETFYGRRSPDDDIVAPPGQKINLYLLEFKVKSDYKDFLYLYSHPTKRESFFSRRNEPEGPEAYWDMIKDSELLPVSVSPEWRFSTTAIRKILSDGWDCLNRRYRDAMQSMGDPTEVLNHRWSLEAHNMRRRTLLHINELLDYLEGNPMEWTKSLHNWILKELNSLWRLSPLSSTEPEWIGRTRNRLWRLNRWINRWRKPSNWESAKLW